VSETSLLVEFGGEQRDLSHGLRMRQGTRDVRNGFQGTPPN